MIVRGGYGVVAAQVNDVMDGIHDIFQNGVSDLIAIAAAVTAITVIFRAARKVWKAYKARADKAEQFYDDFFGVPDRDGVPGRPGVMSRLQAADESRFDMTRSINRLADQQASTEGVLREFASTQRELKDRVEYEMSTNGGGSLRDEVRTLGSEFREVKTALTDHLESLSEKKEESG